MTIGVEGIVRIATFKTQITGVPPDHIGNIGGFMYLFPLHIALFTYLCTNSSYIPFGIKADFLPSKILRNDVKLLQS